MAAVGILALFLTGCVQLAVVDSTDAPRFQAMIGREYALMQPFLIRGVKRNSKDTEPDYILIMPPPGIGGRFITDLGRAPVGSRFKIIGVVTHRSKLFPSTRYVIAFSDRGIVRAAGRKVMINDASGFKSYEKPVSPNGAPTLSRQYFQPIDDS